MSVKAKEVWSVLLERAQGDEDRFRRELKKFHDWAWNHGGEPLEASLAITAFTNRGERKGRPLMRKWGVG